MTPRTRYTFFIDADQRAALAAIKARDGISESEQIRRAVKDWTAKKGLTARQRATARREKGAA